MRRAIAGHTRGLVQRVLAGLARGWLTRVDDATKLQTVQAGVFEGQTTGERERFQQYGFSSVPIPDDGVDVIVAGLGGSQNHTVVLAVEDRRLRPRGQPEGSVALYTQEDDPEAEPEDATARLQLVDDTLVVRFDGKIDLKVGSSRILIEPDGITITASRVDFVRA